MGHIESAEQTVVRFNALHRFLHHVVMVGFTMLGVTGLSIAFSSCTLAQWVVWVFGGPDGAGAVHRFFAVVTYACVLIHAAYFLYYKLVLGGRFTGPHSIVPSLKDLSDLRDHLGYFFGTRKSPPEFDRFTYLEKFDYWAVFMGMNTMGLTGLFLWFPETFSSVLPGFFVNIARVLHLYEAVMAVLLKLFIHVGMAHLRPAVYPADTSIFTGRTTLEKMKEEHPGEYKAYAASGALDAEQKD